MRFSRLRLSGFKSFVDPTELMIEDGLTGVVGPNGCGKSNLLEAVRWVMGENRPSAMRGGGMEDVIFAGAATRPARNYAEVSLLIDNSQHLAPAAFNQDDKLEIIRRITRDVGSAYKTNGQDTRARDVQMLFADASTGAHSPSLVRQGQISELINARPKARRRVLEEAAGISGLYQRRHEAELKLKAAQSNLERMDDIIEQLNTQLKMLERQAKQAKRYRAIGESLRQNEGLLLYRRWQEAKRTQTSAQADLAAFTQAAAAALGDANKAQQARSGADALLPPLREKLAIAAALLQRLMVSSDGLDQQERQAKERVDTLNTRIAQLKRDIERESTLDADAQQSSAKLQTELGEIDRASTGHDDALKAAKDSADHAAQILQTGEAELDQLTQDAARLAARHQSAQRFLDEADVLFDRRQAEMGEIAENLEQARLAHDQAKTAAKSAKVAQTTAQNAQVQAESDLLAAQRNRDAAQQAADDARAQLSQAQASTNAIGAEVEALQRVVARTRSQSDQLIDVVRVQSGYEKALGAALGDDLKVPMADGGTLSGWRALPAYDGAFSLPDGVQPLGDVVDAPDLLKRRLDQIGLVDASLGAILQAKLRPGQRLVSTQGDLWRWDGFVQAGDDVSAGAALHLQQMNRLRDLQAASAEAVEKYQTAKRAFDRIDADFQTAQSNETHARAQRKASDDAANNALHALSKANGDEQICASQLESLHLAQKRLTVELSDAKEAQKSAHKSFDELGDIEISRDKLDARKITVESARVAMMTKRSLLDDLIRDGELRTKRRQEIIGQIADWQKRQSTAQERIAELRQRSENYADELQSALKTPDEIAKKRDNLGDEIKNAELQKTQADDALSKAESDLRLADQQARDAERAAADARETRARAEAVADAANTQAADAAARIDEQMHCAPDALLEQFNIDPDQLPDAIKIEEDVLRLRRQRDALGAVNLRAEEDAENIRTEHDTLVDEKTDLQAAIGELRKGIAGLNKEGRERLLAAFDSVNTSFSALFKRLFNGGNANLVLVESDDPLEAGLELMCQPPGKKLATLSLLSGGEQTLTALALIFAVFLANPAPICVLDEVDAPLDDANVSRFCDMLDEMVQQTETRFLIITHHVLTMARMDRLFGVTMAEKGVSQLVSVDLQAAEQMVDAL